jgi:hypothetical protein
MTGSICNRTTATAGWSFRTIGDPGNGPSGITLPGGYLVVVLRKIDINHGGALHTNQSTLRRYLACSPCPPPSRVRSLASW